MRAPHLRMIVALAVGPAAVVLVVLATVVFALVGLPWWLGTLLAVIAVIGVVWWRLRDAAGATLRVIGASPVPEGRHPRYENLVDGLSLSTGLAAPDLHVLDDPALNAAAVAWGSSCAVVVTTGLLDASDRTELEAVLAGLLSRIKSGDAEAATLAAALLGPSLGGGVGRWLMPLGTQALERLFVADREIEADVQAVGVTRYPPGLQSALAKIGAGPHLPASVTPATQHLLFAPPDSSSGIPHAPLTWRLDVLSEY